MRLCDSLTSSDEEGEGHVVEIESAVFRHNANIAECTQILEPRNISRFDHCQCVSRMTVGVMKRFDNASINV